MAKKDDLKRHMNRANDAVVAAGNILDDLWDAGAISSSEHAALGNRLDTIYDKIADFMLAAHRATS